MIEIINTQYEAQARCNASGIKLVNAIRTARQFDKKFAKRKARFKWETENNLREIRSLIPDSFVHITVV